MGISAVFCLPWANKFIFMSTRPRFRRASIKQLRKCFSSRAGLGLRIGNGRQKEIVCLSINRFHWHNRCCLWLLLPVIICIHCLKNALFGRPGNLLSSSSCGRGKLCRSPLHITALTDFRKSSKRQKHDTWHNCLQLRLPFSIVLPATLFLGHTWAECNFSLDFYRMYEHWRGEETAIVTNIQHVIRW